MLNEILKIGTSLRTLGVPVREFWHSHLPTIPKTDGLRLIVYVDADGRLTRLEKAPEDITKYRYYVRPKHNMAAGIAHRWYPRRAAQDDHWYNKLIRDMDRNFFQVTVKIIRKFATDEPDYRPYLELANRVARIDPETFLAALYGYKEFTQDEAVYICLDNEGGPSVYTEAGNAALNRALRNYRPPEGAKLDDFGHDATGSDIPDTKANHINYFSRNKSNGCFARLGLNSVDTCRIGAQTKLEVNDLMQAAFASDLKGKTWYTYKDGDHTAFVFSSLLFLSGGKMELPDAELIWQEEGESLINASRGVFDDPLASGQILIIRKPSGNGPEILHYSRRLDGEDLFVSLSRWRDGINHGPQDFRGWPFRQINLAQVKTAVNHSLSYKSNEVEVRPRSNQVVDMRQMYEFFLDNPNTIDFLTRFYGEKVAHRIVQASSGTIRAIPSSSFCVVADLILLGNILVHKNGVDNHRDSWAFVFGQLLQEMDYVYYKFFEMRRQSVPEIRLGRHCVEMAMLNPAAALDYCFVKGHPCMSHADNSYNTRLTNYKLILTELYNLCDGNLPSVCDPLDRILLMQGYIWKELYQRSEEEE